MNVIRLRKMQYEMTAGYQWDKKAQNQECDQKNR